MQTITVRVGVVPGTISEVVLNGDRTVASAFRAAGQSIPAGHKVLVNNQEARTDSVVSDGASILAIKQVKGNRR